MKVVLGKNAKNIITATVVFFFFWFLGFTSIFSYPEAFLEGNIVENIQILILLLCLLLITRNIAYHRLLKYLCLLFLFIIFEEINWGGIYFTHSIAPDFSIHNIHNNKVEDCCLIILFTFLIFPKTMLLSLNYLFPSLQLNKLHKFCHILGSIFALETLLITGINSYIFDPHNTPWIDYALEEYFETMLYTLFLWYSVRVHYFYSIKKT